MLFKLRLPKKRYSRAGNWRYHNALRMCQVSGLRLGTASRTDGVWVYYCVDGKVWRFRHGQAVGPLQFDGSLWRSMKKKRFTSISRSRMGS